MTTKPRWDSYKCWVDEEWEYDDAIEVEILGGEPKEAAVKFVEEDLYDCGYFSECGLDESKPTIVWVEDRNGTRTKWEVFGSYFPSFTAKAVV